MRYAEVVLFESATHVAAWTRSRRAAVWHNDQFEVTTELSKLDADLTYEFLATQSEWARGIPRSTFERSIQNSLCFILRYAEKQIGFARVITDRATIAYLGDVFIIPTWRGRRLSKWLMECVVSHPDLAGLRRWIFLTENAHELYRQYGFVPLAHPESYMEIHDPDVYRS